MNTIRLNTIGEVVAKKTSGGVKIIYLNVGAARDAIISSGMNEAALRSQLCFGAVSMKSDYGEGVYDILPFAYPTDDFRKYMIAVAYVDNMKVYDSNGTQMNSSQLIQQYKSMGAYEITEEEFYNLNSDSGNDSAVKEGDKIYYKCNEGVRLNLYPIKDSITQIAVGKIESHNNGSVFEKNAFIDISQIEIYEDGSMIYTATNGAGFTIVRSLAFIYKVGSDLRTAEDIIGNDAITKTTKEEYDNIFTA